MDAKIGLAFLFIPTKRANLREQFVDIVAGHRIGPQGERRSLLRCLLPVTIDL
jgi:hypothetical protein